MAIDPNCTLGGKLLSIHDDQIETKLCPEVLALKDKLLENIMDSKAWLNYAVSLSDYHWINRDAVNAISLAIAIDPFVAEYHFFRGYCHQKLGLLQESVADFEMAWKLDGNHVNAAYYLGMSYFYMGEYERAYRAYQGLYRISPPDAEWAANANWMYLTCMKLGKKEEAQKALEPITPESTPTQSVGTLGNVWDDAYYLMACQMYHGWVAPEGATTPRKREGRGHVSRPAHVRGPVLRRQRRSGKGARILSERTGLPRRQGDHFEQVDDRPASGRTQQNSWLRCNYDFTP